MQWKRFLRFLRIRARNSQFIEKHEFFLLLFFFFPFSFWNKPCYCRAPRLFPDRFTSICLALTNISFHYGFLWDFARGSVRSHDDTTIYAYWMSGMIGRENISSRSWPTDQVQWGPCIMTEGQIFSQPAWPKSVNKHFIIRQNVEIAKLLIQPKQDFLAFKMKGAHLKTTEEIIQYKKKHKQTTFRCFSSSQNKKLITHREARIIFLFFLL